MTRYHDLISTTIWIPEFRQESKSTDSATTLSSVNITVRQAGETLGPDVIESYSLNVPSDKGSIQVVAETVFGVIKALETLHQLVQLNDDGRRSIQFAPIDIQDKPAFSYRGLMLDTARNYFPVSDILRTMDGMSMSKLNVLHWHIVDSQSFGLVSKAVPELSEKGAYRKRGKLLTYNSDDIATIVQYGLERGIRVIPEIDMPGHTRAWAYAFPELIACVGTDSSVNAAEPPAGQLDPTNSETYALLQRLLSDVTTYFSDPYWHAGGDEVNFNCWNTSPTIKDFMSKNNATPKDLVQIFGQKLYQILQNSQKSIMAWEEMVIDFDVKIPGNSVVQVWRGVPNVKQVTEKGYKTVVSSNDFWYLDCGHGNFVNGGKSWCDPYKTHQDVYSFDIVNGLTPEQSRLIIGGEVCLWTEQVDPQNLDRMLWPRASAAAEVLWSGKDAQGENRKWKDAYPRYWDMRVRLVDRGIAAEPLQPLFCANEDCNV